MWQLHDFSVQHLKLFCPAEDLAQQDFSCTLLRCFSLISGAAPAIAEHLKLHKIGSFHDQQIQIVLPLGI